MHNCKTERLETCIQGHCGIMLGYLGYPSVRVVHGRLHVFLSGESTRQLMFFFNFNIRGGCMRYRRLRKTLLWMTPGLCLWLSCPSGFGRFLAPIVEPILQQALSEVTTALTDQLLDQINNP